MSKLSRRTLVTSAAALPALAVPALASNATDLHDPNHPDAELLRLGVQLEALIVDWHAQGAIDADHYAARMAACEAAGLPSSKLESLPEDERRAYQDKRIAVMSALHLDDDDINEAGGSIAWNDIHGRMWPLIDVIFDHKAQSVAGLAMLARAVSLSHEELWTVWAG